MTARTRRSLVVEEAAAVLARTPGALEALLRGLPEDWIGANEGRRGRHPELGGVTLRQLLAAWVAHDLDHVVQVSQVLARQYSDEVGAWRAYLRVISGQQG